MSERTVNLECLACNAVISCPDFGCEHVECPNCKATYSVEWDYTDVLEGNWASWLVPKNTVPDTLAEPVEAGPTPEGKEALRKVLAQTGHTAHCAARLVHGDGACECGLPLAPQNMVRGAPTVPTFDEYREAHPEASFIECALNSAPVATVESQTTEIAAGVQTLIEALEAKALEAESLLDQLDAQTAKTALRTFSFDSRIRRIRGLMVERRHVIAELKASFEREASRGR